MPQSSLNNLSVTLTVQQFANAVTGVIKEAIGIAKGLMESGLRRQEAPQENSSKEQLDWLILSGKTCNLDLVRKELKQQFSKSDRFVWNPERITFVPEYTLASPIVSCGTQRELPLCPNTQSCCCGFLRGRLTLGELRL
ncbi:MAG: hypothetical protein GDA43_21795 [Hormoscilla sp. SP5CHS1]|nr:hypothetical protein [Hormoscilla sp. SP5CHS1]